MSKNNIFRAFLITIFFLLYIFNLNAGGERDSHDIGVVVQKMEYTGITKVTIDNQSSFNVKVIGTEEIILYGEIVSENLNAYNIKYYRVDNELFIKISKRRFSGNPINNNIILNVPLNTELYIRTETGIILIENCSGYKDLSAETGDIIFK